MHHPDVLYSNRLEMLAEQLGIRLFGESTRPFEKRIVVVPHDEMKGFLLAYFARHPRFQVAMGMQVLTLSQSFVELFGLIGMNRSKKVPSFVELSIQLEALIFSALQEDRDPSLEPIRAYLEKTNGNTRRLGALCDHLSRLFSCYGLYAGASLEGWLKKKGWQQSLWRGLFSDPSPWTYPSVVCQKFLSLWQAAKPSLHGSSPFQVHLFGFNFLPPVYVAFFEQLNAAFYQLSFCAQYWEDLSSDKEDLFRNQQLEKKSHPLLANWGKLGRQMMKILDRETMVVESYYIEPQGQTLLAHVQRDLLHLHLSKRDHIQEDASIQVHSVPSKLREIEVLHDALSGLMHKRGFAPREILVLAPDIELYAPLIHMVFGGGQIPYSIHGIKGLGHCDFSLGFAHLFSLAKGQFSAEEVMKLFEFRSFVEKAELTLEEVAVIRRWVRQAKIRFGWDSEQEDFEAGTWRSGFDRLLFGLAMIPDEEAALKESSLPVWPCPIIDLTEIDLLDKFIRLIEQLHEDVEILSQEAPRSIVEWIDRSEQLIVRYFQPSASLDSFVSRLKRLSLGLNCIQERCFTFESIQRLLTHLQHQSRGTFSLGELQKVTFASLEENPIQPARVIWLLGMDESCFPRTDKKSSLSELKTEYIPRLVDQDRFLFLEQLSLAQDVFALSFERVSAEDQKDQGPSLLVQELLAFLRNTYQIDEDEIRFDHPALPLDPLYFSSTSRFQSFSQEHYRQAQSYAGPRLELKPFKPRVLSEKIELFEVRKLAALARNPIKFYLQEALGIFFRFEEEEEHAEFVLSSLLKSKLRKTVAKGLLPARWNALKAQGELPLGAFHPIAVQQVEQEALSLNTSLHKFQFDLELSFSVELSLSCTEPVRSLHNHWILPALKVPMPEGRQVHVVGKLDNLFPNGMLFDGKEGIMDAVKCWPLFLIYLNLPLFPEENKGVLWTKNGKYKTPKVDRPEHLLSLYLNYAERASIEPSFLMPQWADALLFQEPQDLEKLIAKVGENSTGYVDEALLWMKRRNAFPSALEILSQWKEDLAHVFEPMIDLWFTKGEKHAEV
ncbi:MAG: exodeoxyribonuclease V subunit gamma [Rhabdochlamydiaceae bacterium]|nr:exodeoxyribonuclease V subunit gamma [Rhabdochlamydiaceae bacterium]